ncbi:hypothetical protein [Sphingomonas oryzagri]
MTALIIFAYAISVWLNVLALRRINLKHLQFIDGVVLGLTYYITAPLGIILVYGRVAPLFLPISDYYPYQDIYTTALFLMGSLSISLLKIAILPLLTDNDLLKINKISKTKSFTITNIVIISLVLLYLPMDIYRFKASGVSEGAHWFKAGLELSETNSTFLLITRICGYIKVVIFGALAFASIERPKRKLTFISVGTFIALFDLFTTFNRATIVYLLLMCLIAFHKRIYTGIIALSVFLFSNVYISAIWPEFRGQISNYGYSPTGLSYALAKAIEVNSGNGYPFVDKMNGIFESFSFTVVNWIVYHRSIINADATSYFTRPLTVLIPRSLWPDRPQPFADVIGHEFSKYLSLNSYLFGEAYASSSLLWPVFMIIWIIFYSVCFTVMSNQHRIWGFMGAFLAFAWWRFDSSFAAIGLILTIVLFFGIRIASGQTVPARLTVRRKHRLPPLIKG